MSPKIQKLIRTGDDPVLKRKCRAVGTSEDISDLMALMEKVCKKSRTGVGLAAPQVGHAVRVIYLNTEDERGTVRGQFMVNPELLETSPETEVEVEGCLSYPGVYKHIRRHLWVKVSYQTSPGSKVRERTLQGYIARVAQHEIDHLDGVCRVGDPAYPDEKPEESKSGLAAASFAGILASAVCLNSVNP